MPAAARIYFDKDVSELNLGESAMLAGIIRAPSQLNPINNPDGCAPTGGTRARCHGQGRKDHRRAGKGRDC